MVVRTARLARPGDRRKPDHRAGGEPGVPDRRALSGGRALIPVCRARHIRVEESGPERLGTATRGETMDHALSRRAVLGAAAAATLARGVVAQPAKPKSPLAATIGDVGGSLA